MISSPIRWARKCPWICRSGISLLKRAATLQQPREQRNWALLTAMLDNVEAIAPNDPWVPIMRAELALAGEKPEEPKKVAETPEGNQVAEQTPAAAKDSRPGKSWKRPASRCRTNNRSGWHVSSWPSSRRTANRWHSS